MGGDADKQGKKGKRRKSLRVFVASSVVGMVVAMVPIAVASWLYSEATAKITKLPGLSPQLKFIQEATCDDGSGGPLGLIKKVGDWASDTALGGIKTVTGALGDASHTASRVVATGVDVVIPGEAGKQGARILRGVGDVTKGGGELVGGLADYVRIKKDVACLRKKTVHYLEEQGADDLSKQVHQCKNWPVGSPFLGPVDKDFCIGDERDEDAADQPPSWLTPIYQQASQRYRVPWQLLAAINWNDTSYGANAVWREADPKTGGRQGWIPFRETEWAKVKQDAGGVPPRFLLSDNKAQCPEPLDDDGKPVTGGYMGGYQRGGKFPELEGLREGAATYYNPALGGINGREGGGAYVPVYEEGWGAARLFGHGTGGGPAAWLGVVVRVTNTKTGRSIEVPILDNGPGAPADPVLGNKIIDLLPEPMKALNNGQTGNIPVKIEPIGRISREAAKPFGTGSRTGAATGSSDAEVSVSFVPDGQQDECDPVDSIFALAQQLHRNGVNSHVWYDALNNGQIDGDSDQAATPIARRGDLIWPVRGTVTAPYCEIRNYASGPACHPGIDIGLPTGHPIQASGAGKVVVRQLEGQSGGYGNFVCVQHNDTIQTCYAHLSKFNVEMGDQVDQGAKIGEVGSTGRSSGPHLHFEVRVNGSHRNPSDYIACTPAQTSCAEQGRQIDQNTGGGGGGGEQSGPGGGGGGSDGGGKALVVGDSLAVGTKSLMGDVASGWKFTTDAVEGRHTPEGIKALRTHEKVGDALIVSLGTNDPSTPAATFRQQVNTIVNHADGKCVVWPNLATKGHKTIRDNAYDQMNKVLDDAADRHGNLTVVDWASVVRGGGIKLDGEGTHPDSAGYRKRAKMIADALQSCGGYGSPGDQPGGDPATVQVPPGARTKPPANWREHRHISFDSGLPEIKKPSEESCRRGEPDSVPGLQKAWVTAGAMFGIDWHIIGGVSKIETGHGCNLNVSSAGAEGWTQFMPDTWKSYGVDANDDGKADPWTALDATFATARYLRASCPNDCSTMEDIRKAIFAYNHADWYVDQVLANARDLGAIKFGDATFKAELDGRIADAVQMRNHTIDRSLCPDQDRYVDCIAYLYARISGGGTGEDGLGGLDDDMGEANGSIVEIAREELKRGVKEQPSGSDDGPRIREYRKAVKEWPTDKAGPWCAMFVSWVAKQAGVPIGPQGTGISYVPNLHTWAKQVRRARGADYTPKPGDLIAWDPQHVGIVERVTDTQIITIEGNSSNAVNRRTYNKDTVASTRSNSTFFYVEMPSSPTARKAEMGDAPRPKIVQKPINYDGARKADMAAYSKRHYGTRTWRLREPSVIVQHFTVTSTFEQTFNTFAPNRPDPEFNEKPGTCSHYVIDKDGTIYQLVPLSIRCRHTVGLNHTAIGIEHVGSSASQVMGNRKQLDASLKLTRWLRCTKGIDVDDVIGHAESLSSPFHRERVAAMRDKTHSDFKKAEMDDYRRDLRAEGGCGSNAGPYQGAVGGG